MKEAGVSIPNIKPLKLILAKYVNFSSGLKDTNIIQITVLDVLESKTEESD